MSVEMSQRGAALRSAWWWSAGAALALLGLASEPEGFGWGRPDQWVPDLAVGWCLIGFGLLVGADPARRRAGVLLGAAGVAWFLPNLVGAGDPVVSWVGAQSGSWHRGPLLHLLLTYPTVAARPWIRRAQVAAAYAVSAVPAMWQSWTSTTVIVALLVAVCGRTWWVATGPSRMGARRGFVAAMALAAALELTAAVYALAPSGRGAGTTLLVYELSICGLAFGLAVPLLRAAEVPVEITDLVVQVAGRAAPTLRGALGGALADPSLELGYWTQDGDRYVDADGRPLVVDAGRPGRAVTYVAQDGRPVAVLIHDPGTLADPQVREAVELATRLGAANARLRLELGEQMSELAASTQRIVRAAVEARQQLGERLHGGAERRLTTIGELLASATPEAPIGAARERVSQARHRFEGATEDVGRIARGLHPRALADGLASALAARVADLDVPAELEVMLSSAVPAELQAMAYFVCSEALTNVVKHADASLVRVGVTERSAGLLCIEVVDDGRGGAVVTAGSGLRGLTDRVGAYGGTLRLDSPTGGGTRLRVDVPWRIGE